MKCGSWQTLINTQLGRQSLEVLLIREADPEELINNKEEWVQPGDIRAVFNAEGREGAGWI